jgi:hypothetical protein
MEERWDLINKRFIMLVSVILAIFISSKISAVTINPGFEFVVGNETYTVQQTMDFSIIIIDSTYIIFNDTGFYLTAPNDITITLVYINDDIAGAGDGDKVVEFNADTSGGNVLFDLSGFTASTDYIVKRNGTQIANPTANGSGYISFSNNIWSSHSFEISQDGEGPGDTTAPETSNMNVAQSDPIDTESGFGWENFTCTVTDNVEVNNVFINITCSGSSTTNVSMTKISGTDQYYYNTILSHGNYTYFIWANDTSDNTDVSSGSTLFVPPNWDINKDGGCIVLDLNLVSNHFDETGAAGWIREDVDNNGEIKVLDIVFLSNNYGETWWV